MMLPSMNVTIIPFLIEAFMSMKDVTEWNFGPEYVFQLNKTTIVFKNHFEVQDITAMVYCRPNVSSQNNLLCHARKIIVSKITQQIYKSTKPNKISDTIKPFISYVSNKMPDEFFEIQFGKQGVQRVQDFTLNARRKQTNRYDSITDIIEQFHIGTDLSVVAGESMKNYENRTSGLHVISFFPQYEEDTTRGFKCNTSWIIAYTPSNEYNEDGEIETRKNRAQFDFHLKLLPISYTNAIGKTFLIERTRMACKQPQYLMVFNEKLRIRNMTEYFTKMEIHNKKPKFTSHTHLEGNVFFPKNFRLYHFSEDVHLHLLRIRPARNNITTKYR